MKSVNSSPRTASLARSAVFRYLPLVASLAACSSDSVTMGEDGSEAGATPPATLPTNGLCRESTTYVGDLFVSDQQDIDRLEGCQVIDGNLHIGASENVDLRPLRALTRVSESLGLTVPVVENDPRETPIFESLEGLEALEIVGSLQLHGLLADNVRPLANLRWLTRGYLSITNSPNLTSLDGLAELRGVSDINLDCASLEDIAPLELSIGVTNLSLRGKFSQLSPLGVGIATGSFTISGTGLKNLDALSSLAVVVGTLSIEDNLLLEQMDGLEYVTSLGALSVQRNPGLAHWPALPFLHSIGDVTIAFNDRLAEVPLFGRDVPPATDIDPLSLLDRSSAQALITDNAALTAVTLPRIWPGGSALVIGNNPLLTQVQLTEQLSYDYVNIADNASLSSFELGALATVDVLEVANNPQLDTRVFDPLQTFEVRMSENAASP